jgi:26S proteasome non-ATPase regulatory subunit RPN1 C-terminal
VGGCATQHCSLPRFVTMEASTSDAFLSSISLILIMCTIQTHTTPVLLGHRDRAELAGQEYSTLVSVMEGVVIVEKIPEQAVQT